MSVDTRLLFELGLRLIAVIVKAGLAILGVGGQGGCGAPVVVNLWSSLMAFCPATHALNGVLALMCSTLQMAVHGVDSSSLIACPVRVVVFAISVAGSNEAASLADCSASQVRSCAVAFFGFMFAFGGAAAGVGRCCAFMTKEKKVISNR